MGSYIAYFSKKKKNWDPIFHFAMRKNIKAASWNVWKNVIKVYWNVSMTMILTGKSL